MERLLGNEDKLKDFYLALEDRFRGSKQEIKKKAKPVSSHGRFDRQFF